MGVFIMILIDRNIKELADQKKLIVSGYKEENVNGISYDLTMDVMCDEDGHEHAEYELAPGEVVFVKTQEKLSIPRNILGRIAEKNSRMRQGLKVDGPHYQPGHVTYAFLRVQNISSKIIALKQGMKIAQIIFEELTEEPDVPYSEQKKQAFQDEVTYRGLGNYKEEYEKQIKEKIAQANENLESISEKIYANVLTIMGVLVAVFSLLTINYQAFSTALIDFHYILVMNLTLALCIVLLMGIIMIFVNHARNKIFLWIYAAVLVVLAMATVCMAFAL